MILDTDWNGRKAYSKPGGTSLSILRDIPPLSKYAMYSRFIAWSPDNKWLYCQTIFTIPDKRGGARSEHVPSAIPDDEAVCAIVYGRYCWNFKSGEDIFVTDILEKEGYFVTDGMSKLNRENWELVKLLHELWEKENIIQTFRKLAKL